MGGIEKDEWLCVSFFIIVYNNRRQIREKNFSTRKTLEKILGKTEKKIRRLGAGLYGDTFVFLPFWKKYSK